MQDNASLYFPEQLNVTSVSSQLPSVELLSSLSQRVKMCQKEKAKTAFDSACSAEATTEVVRIPERTIAWHQHQPSGSSRNFLEECLQFLPGISFGSSCDLTCSPDQWTSPLAHLIHVEQEPFPIPVHSNDQTCVPGPCSCDCHWTKFYQLWLRYERARYWRSSCSKLCRSCSLLSHA